MAVNILPNPANLTMTSRSIPHLLLKQSSGNFIEIYNSESGYLWDRPMAYLCLTEKISDQGPCDNLRDWLLNVEFSLTDNTLYIRLCRNVLVELLHYFKKEV